MIEIIKDTLPWSNLIADIILLGGGVYILYLVIVGQKKKIEAKNETNEDRKKYLLKLARSYEISARITQPFMPTTLFFGTILKLLASVGQTITYHFP